MDTADKDGAACTAPLLNALKVAEGIRAVTPTNQPLPAVMRAALAPFAPKDSDVHFTEAELVEMDMAMHRYKTSGAQQQYEDALLTGAKSRYGRGVY